MAKAVFRPEELVTVPDKITLNTPQFVEFVKPSAATAEDEADFEEAEDVYTGPTAEELRREAEDFRAEWEIEKKEMVESAKTEANEIVSAADLSASRKREEAAQEADSLKAAAQEEADKIVAEAKKQSEELEAETRKTLEDERKAALEQGKEEGRLEGYAEGKVEVERLIQRTQTVLERAQDKRGEILTETEQEIINLVLLITRKVVKVIADNQREVIISNVVQALRKVRERGTIIIRVNIADLKLTTEHTKDFIQMMEGVKSIQVVEDSSVDVGGCIIETDFGEIDARIASQLAELEAKILEVAPIRTKSKPAAPAAKPVQK